MQTVMPRDLDPEVEAILACWAAIRRTIGRAARLSRRALLGRAVIVGTAALVLVVLALYARPGITTTGNAKVVITEAVDATTGQPVSRPEWLERAEHF